MGMPPWHSCLRLVCHNISGNATPNRGLHRSLPGGLSQWLARASAAGSGGGCLGRTRGTALRDLLPRPYVGAKVWWRLRQLFALGWNDVGLNVDQEVADIAGSKGHNLFK